MTKACRKIFAIAIWKRNAQWLSVFAHEINKLPYVSSFNLIAVLCLLTVSFFVHSLKSHTRKDHGRKLQTFNLGSINLSLRITRSNATRISWFFKCRIQAHWTYYLLSAQGSEHVRHSFSFVFTFTLLKIGQTSYFVLYCLFNKHIPFCRASVQ